MSFFTALRFLTIIPTPSIKNDEPEMPGRSMPFFPVIGLLIGGILYGLYLILHMVFPMPVTGALLVACLAIITGAHHLDGLIDTCDGMVAGRTREQRLSIMSDTRVGAFGITGVCLLLLVKYAAISGTVNPAALILFPMASRWALGSCILIFPSAKKEGMGFATKSSASRTGFVVSTVFAVIISIVFAGLIEGLLLLVILFALTCCLGSFLSRLFGGLTGDCYGALVETGEVLVLLSAIVLGQFSQLVPGHGIFKLALPAG